MKTQLIIIAVLIYAGISGHAMAQGEWRKASKEELLGAWKLLSFKEPRDSIFQLKRFPDEAIKLNTASHYSFSYFNRETAKFEMAGGGSYVLEGGIYREKMEYFSLVPGLVGKSFSFTMLLKGDTLHQKSVQPNGMEEYWLRLR